MADAGDVVAHPQLSGRRDPQGDQFARLHRRAVGAVLAIALAGPRAGAAGRRAVATRRASSRWPTSTTSASTATTPTSATPTRPSAATTRSPARATRRSGPRPRRGRNGSRCSACGRPPSLFCCQQWQPDRTVPPLPTAATPHEGPGDRQPARPGHAVPGGQGPRPHARQRELLTWDGEGHTSYLQGSTLRRQLRERVPGRRDPAAGRHDLPAPMSEPHPACRSSPATATSAPSRSSCTAAARTAPTAGARAASSPCCGWRPFATSLRRAGHRARAGRRPAALPRPRLERLEQIPGRRRRDGRSTSSPSGSPAPRRARRALDGRPGGDVRRRPRIGAARVVGLAPWIEPGDPFAQLAGRRVLVAHGDRDRMTQRAASAACDPARPRAVAASASYVSIRGERHAMLRRARLWHELTDRLRPRDAVRCVAGWNRGSADRRTCCRRHLPGSPRSSCDRAAGCAPEREST